MGQADNFVAVEDGMMLPCMLLGYFGSAVLQQRYAF
jgi:hypothetical protein